MTQFEILRLRIAMGEAEIRYMEAVNNVRKEEREAIAFSEGAFDRVMRSMNYAKQKLDEAEETFKNEQGDDNIIIVCPPDIEGEEWKQE